MRDDSRSPYWLEEQDEVVRVASGEVGIVEQASALYYVVRWPSGEAEEVAQLDPALRVDLRAAERTWIWTTCCVRGDRERDDLLRPDDWVRYGCEDAICCRCADEQAREAADREEATYAAT